MITWACRESLRRFLLIGFLFGTKCKMLDSGASNFLFLFTHTSLARL